jgi:hypothetical protein
VRQKNLTVFKSHYIGNRVVWDNVTMVSGKLVSCYFRAMEHWTGQNVLPLLKVISRMAIHPLLHNDYFAETLSFFVMAVFPVVTP